MRFKHVPPGTFLTSPSFYSMEGLLLRTLDSLGYSLKYQFREHLTILLVTSCMCFNLIGVYNKLLRCLAVSIYLYHHHRGSQKGSALN